MKQARHWLADAIEGVAMWLFVKAGKIRGLL
jgi:hypothetical protein